MGTRAGMTLAEAGALVGRSRLRLQVEDFDGFEDQRVLEELASSCHRFAPTIGLEEASYPETLLLDITGVTHLFDGESSMCCQVVSHFQKQNLVARLGVGKTVGAAWALAHNWNTQTAEGDQSIEFISSGACSDRDVDINVLPLRCLRLSEKCTGTLQRLGLRNIGDLLPLPRADLQSRFGSQLLVRLDQALGTQTELIQPIQPPPKFLLRETLEFPIGNHQMIALILERLLQKMCQRLTKHARGALQLQFRIDCQDAEPIVLEVGCFRPSTDPEHLQMLFETPLEKMRLPADAIEISLEVSRSDHLQLRQHKLFDTDSTRMSPHVAALIDRMAGRLGRKAVVHAALRSNPLPENAFQYQPLVGGAKPRRASQATAPATVLDRPFHVLDEPVVLGKCELFDDTLHAFEYQGRRHHVSRRWGPERLETEWWQNRGVRRDYYRVETATGTRFWLFQDRRTRRWFLHGIFA